MPLLIDGHNLIGQLPDLELSDPRDEEKLITRLQRYAETSSKRLTVVFDPNPLDTSPQMGHGKSQHGKVQVIYAPAEKKADDIIRNMVSDVKDRQGLVVVTSDAAVADFTRRCGVRVISSQDFIRVNLITSKNKAVPAQKPVGSLKEVVNWADVFREPEPKPTDTIKPVEPKLKKGQKRSEQLKRQVKNTRPLK